MRVNGRRHIYNTLSSYEYGVDVQLAASSHGASKTKPIMTSACYRYTANLSTNYVGYRRGW